jgi:hypothetical protein
VSSTLNLDQMPTRDCRDAALELVPSLEFEPADIAPDLVRGPNSYGEKLWHEAMAHAGIGDLPLLAPDSWFVATRAVTDSGINALLTRHFEKYPYGNSQAIDDNELPPLAASFAVEVGGSIVAIPSCCTDIGDLSLWREAAAGAGNSLWIGHMTLTGFRLIDGIEVSLTPEYANVSNVLRLRFAYGQLDAAIDRAEAALTQFSARFEPLVAKMVGERFAPRVTELLLARNNKIG